MALSDFYSERATRFSFRLRNIRNIRTMPPDAGTGINSADSADYAYTDLKNERPRVNPPSPAASASPASGLPRPHEREVSSKLPNKDTVGSGEARLDLDGVTSEKLRKNGGSTAKAKPEKGTKEVVQGEAEIVRKPSIMPLTDADEKWLKDRLEHPSRILSSDLVGIRLARHYDEGGEAVGYRHPTAFLDVDGIPERFAESNQALRAGLAMCKFPSRLVTVRSDAGGHDFWDVTGRGMELFRRLSDGLEDYTESRWFQRAMSGDVMPKRPAYQREGR